MPKRITQLTEAQRARFEEWSREWIEHGLRAGPADFARFERAAERCYGFAGIAWPKNVVRVSSPIVGAFAAPLAGTLIALFRRFNASKPSTPQGVRGRSVRGAVRGAVGGAVDGAVDDAVRGAVGGAVDDAVGGAVGGAVRGAVGGAVDGAVGGAVRGAVDDAVRGAVGGAVGGAVRGAVGDAGRRLLWWHYYLGGQFWSWWHAYVTFFLDVCNWQPDGDITERARAYAETALSTGYWWPNKDFVMVSDRPTKILRDDQGRLHAEDGKAIEWPDGWGLWMWHGVNLGAIGPKAICFPEQLTIDDIRVQTNAEIRRIVTERYGPGRYLSAVNAKVLDIDSLTLAGSACRALMQDDVGAKWLVGTDGSTKRVYHMPVPRDVNTCREAHNAIAGFNEERLIAEA